MLYIPKDSATTTPVPSKAVTGRFLAHNRLGKRARAKLAADILAQRVVVIDLTAKQLATICGVSVPYIMAAREPDRVPARLLREWERASGGQRIAFARAAGAERVFDVVVQAAA